MRWARVPASAIPGLAFSTLALFVSSAEAPSPTAAAQAPPPVTTSAWLPRDTAELTVLDKISTRLSPVQVKVGEAVKVGPLAIGVRACLVRPPDVPADATAFLDVTDSTPGAPEFHGWMLLSTPAVSAMQHPVYDVRLSACR